MFIFTFTVMGHPCLDHQCPSVTVYPSLHSSSACALSGIGPDPGNKAMEKTSEACAL